MKTFKDIINEVAEPRSPDERRFKAKHVIKKFNHPTSDETEENQFKGGTEKDDTVKASYKDGADEEVYENAKQNNNLLGKTDLQELTAKQIKGKIMDVEQELKDAKYDQKDYRAAKAQQKLKQLQKALKLANATESVEHDLDEAKSSLMKTLSKYNKRAKEGKKKEDVKEESLEEKRAPKLKDDYVKTQREKDRAHDAAMGRTRTGRKKPVRAMSSTKRSLASMREDSGYTVDKDGKNIKKFKKKAKNMTPDKGDVEIVDGEYVEQYIDEAVRAGNLKLNDGTRVKVTNEDAQAMNDLFQELNSSNKKRMEEEMMKDKDGFEKVLDFAREASED